MGYTRSDGRWANTEDVTLLDGIVTESGSTTAIELGDRSTLRLGLDVIAAEGEDAKLDVTIETSHDDVTFRSLGTFTQKAAVGIERKSFVGCDRFIRASYTLTGEDASFTLTISGEAV